MNLRTTMTSRLATVATALARGSFAGLLVTVILSGPTSAGEIRDHAARAESLAANGKYVEAIETLDRAATSLSDKSPLSFRTALWVDEAPPSFGVYNPRKTNAYIAGDNMFAYAELVGIGWRKAGDTWQTDFAADFILRTKDGRELFSQKDFAKSQPGESSSRLRIRELMARFTVTLNNIPAGEYMAEFTVRDAVSGKRGAFSLPFVIVSP
jgi:hypothetical protein